MAALSTQGRVVLDQLWNAIEDVKRLQSLNLPFKKYKDGIRELNSWTKDQDWWKDLPKDMIEEYNDLYKKAQITVGLK